ncbi:MAG: hypothetical protein M3303_11655 [Gemmatimonadota bacterium]|nr:hypothetical protein [Gemmatimonadota bacterium]
MLRTVRVPLLALVLAATPLQAQDTARVAVPGAKNPVTARVIGIVPGAGHVYAGETMRGLTYFGSTAAIFLLAGLMFASDCIGGEDCGDSATPGLVAVAGFAYWGWTIYDAGRAAERANARRRWLRVSLIAAPVRPMLIGGNEARAVKLGLSLGTR